MMPSPRAFTKQRRRLQEAHEQQRQHARARAWQGFALACLGYLILAFQQPTEWGMILWAVLAFLVVPVGAGVFVAFQTAESAMRARFFTGLRIGAWAMGIYTGIELCLVHSRIGSNPNTGAVFLVGSFVTLIYALLAGNACGMACALARPGQKETRIEPAP